jgi:serine/threonine protein kinase
MKGIKQINNYRLTRLIGKGATAKVYEAIDDKTKNVVAVKEIEASKLNDPRIMENFKRELRLLSKFKNSNIIKILDLQKTRHNLYLILEYCNGGNLFEYKTWYEKNKKCQINELFIQKILKQLIVGLEYMHNNNSIHRDIKLENILLNFTKIPNKVQNDELPQKVVYNKVSLNDPFQIKIADLGYARELEGVGIASTMCGTPITMAPDVALQDPKEDKHTYNTKADLWSLGAITYELLIGKPPFYANNYKELFKQIENGKYSLPRKMKLSTEIISFINGLLQFYPDKRMDWKQIKEHPFLTKNVKDFNFLDLETIDAKGDKKNLELNVKNCDNYLWLDFKQHDKLNMKIDKINNEAVNDPKIKTIIQENKIKNDDILKAIEEEKKKLEEEKKKIEEDRKKQEEEKKKNEELKKQLEEQLKKIEEVKKKQEEEKKKNEEIKKQLEEEKEKNKEEINKKFEELKKEKESIKEKQQNINDMNKELISKYEEKLKSEIEKKNQIEKELQKKNIDNKLLENKIKLINDENDKKILQIKKENEEKILELKDNLKINSENNNNNINDNNNKNENENDGLEDWEDLDAKETKSIQLDYEINEENDGFEVIDDYMESQ